ncbi:MAG: hypothetical protein Q8M94_09370 [Ignavibacteria bacterium]|nr:hypothetical protein [Ignavibacteria bacterium]
MALIDSLDAIKAILSCVQADGSQVSDALLEEKNEAKLKKLQISELAPGMLLLATDEGRKRNKASACMSPLFADDGVFDQNRACDAVLLRKMHCGYEVCYIELKSDAPSGYEGQFKSTQCFIRYLSVLIEKLCGLAMIVNRERFVVFHTDSNNGSRRGLKQKTRFTPRSANTSSAPDMFCVRNGSIVRYSEFF